MSEFRARLVQRKAERLLLDTLLERLRERGLLKKWGRQRTDSTHILAAVRVLNLLPLRVLHKPSNTNGRTQMQHQRLAFR